MKKVFFKILKIVAISFILMMILSEIIGDANLACAIVFAMIGLYVTYLLILSYIKSINKYKSGEELPAYAKLILVIAMSAMASGKSFHTHYTSVKTVGESTDELQKNKEAKIPIIVYTFTMISVIAFVIFIFFLSLIEYTDFREIFVQGLLSTSFISIVIAILTSLLNYIYSLIREMIRRKQYVNLALRIGLIVAIFLIVGIAVFNMP